jgi:hypothetical protein
VSPKLFWESMIKKGIAERQLTELANRYPLAFADLQWI